MSQRSGDEPRQSKLADGGPCPHDANYQWTTVPGPCRGRLRSAERGAHRCDACGIAWVDTLGARASIKDSEEAGA